MTRTGVLPMQMLQELVTSDHITGIDEKYINPASIDLPLSDEAYRLESIFLPLPGEKIRKILPFVGAVYHDLARPLEVGVPYLIRIAGTWNLPNVVYGYVNPKSSTGRSAFFCRVVADMVDMYEALVEPGWSGEMFVLVRADYFPVQLEPGIPLSQVRLFDGKAFLDGLHTELAIKQHGLLFDHEGKKLCVHDVRRHAEAFFLTLEVSENMGWECIESKKIADLRRNDNPADAFFKKVGISNGAYVLRKGRFYILTTKERVLVSPKLSAELRAIEPRFGEFRSHAAGYIDPGWGWGNNGEACGRPITLEVIPHEDMLVRDGQMVARLRYEHMKEAPDISYDQADSNYTKQQGPMLAKYFGG